MPDSETMTKKSEVSNDTTVAPSSVQTEADLAQAERSILSKKLLFAGALGLVGQAVGSALGGAEVESQGDLMFKQMSQGLINQGLTIKDQELLYRRERLNEMKKLSGVAKAIGTMPINPKLVPMKQLMMQFLADGAIDHDDAVKMVGSMVDLNLKFDQLGDQEQQAGALAGAVGKVNPQLGELIKPIKDMDTQLKLLSAFKSAKDGDAKGLSGQLAQLAIDSENFGTWVQTPRGQAILKRATNADGNTSTADQFSALAVMADEIKAAPVPAAQLKDLMGATEIHSKVEQIKVQYGKILEMTKNDPRIAKLIVTKPGAGEKATKSVRQFMTQYSDDAPQAFFELQDQLNELLGARIKYFTGAQASDAERKFFARFNANLFRAPDRFVADLDALDKAFAIRAKTINDYFKTKGIAPKSEEEMAKIMSGFSKEEREALGREIVSSVVAGDVSIKSQQEPTPAEQTPEQPTVTSSDAVLKDLESRGKIKYR